MKLPSPTVPICLTHLWGCIPTLLSTSQRQKCSQIFVSGSVSGGRHTKTSTRDPAARVLARPGLGLHSFLSGRALQRCPWERQPHLGSPHLSSVQRSPFALSSGVDSSSLQHLQPLCRQPFGLLASSLRPSWVTFTKTQLPARPFGTNSCLEAEVQICKPWHYHC